ncbi:MAG: signal peptidase II [Desulfuromonadales bacterium]|nr:signal peptidase II [Desulfuromonadales bacterium]
MKLMKRVLLIAPVLLCCVGCDQLTKNIARQGLANSEPISFLNNMVRLQYSENPGAFLSLGAGSPETIRFWIFTVCVGGFLASMFVYLLVYPHNSKAHIISLSLVIGGGVGNLIDRIFNEGRVIDFLNVGIGPLRTGVFNVADIVISCGIVWFIATSSKSSKRECTESFR